MNNLYNSFKEALEKVEKPYNKIIFIENKPIRPGKGVGKNLGLVGDISIKGIIGLKSDSTCFEIIQNTRLSVVYDLAKLTFESINGVLEEKQTKNEIACTK
ncbi:DUF1256 domain-containing protein [Clostridium botulinum]|nr:DUF1256 domain-containing protein [Clostridium botulinum]MBO0560276.1 DUF1256 domain-containing protein [Clostridium botulinum]